MSDGEPSPSGEQSRHGEDAAHDARNAERNATIALQFQNLPAAGSLAYWAALGDVTSPTRLELETLVLCVRERLAAGARDQAERVLGLLWDRSQGEARRLIESATPQGARNRAGVIEEIMQECVIALWQEIAQKDETFLTRGYWHKLRYLVANAITQGLIAEGLWTRSGVKRADRVPQSQTDSADQPARADDAATLGQTIADPRAPDAFGLAETGADLLEAASDLTAGQKLLLWNTLTEELTQNELGERLKISDRAVRMRLTALRAWLRKRLYGLDDPPDARGGGAAGSEEG